MYEYKTRIRYSEVDSDGQLSLVALLDYFQDCSTFHSEDLGLGIDYLKKNKMIWALSSWQIVVERYPKMGEYVIVGTAPYDFKSFIGFRNFWMKDEQENVIACANSIWSLIDSENGKPVKPTEDMIQGYILSEKINMNYEDRHVKFEGEARSYSSITVKAHNIDTNNHVNNGQYIRMGMDCLKESLFNKKVKQLRAEYKMQAYLDTVLYPICYEYDSKIGISLKNKEGKPYCNMEFLL